MPKEQRPVIIDTLSPVRSGNTVVSDILRKPSARFVGAIRTAGLVLGWELGVNWVTHKHTRAHMQKLKDVCG